VSDAGIPGDWNATTYDHRHSYVTQYGASLVDLLNPQPGEQILDLGCGTAHLTQEIAERGAGVVGVDASPSMIDRARELFPTLDLRVADAADLGFEVEFDAIFSNAVFHWVARERHPELAAGIARALRPGGRLVTEFGGKDNLRWLRVAMVAALASVGVAVEPDFGPWYFPSIGAYASTLEDAGLEVLRAELYDRFTRVDEQGLRSWIETFAADFPRKAPPAHYDTFIAEVERIARPRLFRDGFWYVDYRRLRVEAIKTADDQARV